MRRSTDLSGYRAVWLLAMFDLPVKTREDRRRYTHWRKRLLRAGFIRLQYSIYAHHFQTEEQSVHARRRLVKCVPLAGEVRFLTVTERQIEKMEVIVARKHQPPESAPPQLILF